MNVRKVAAKLTNEERRFAAKEKLDAQWMYAIGPDAAMSLPVRAGETWRIAIMTEATAGTRVSVVARQGGVVLGGSTFIFKQGIPRLTGALH